MINEKKYGRNRYWSKRLYENMIWTCFHDTFLYRDTKCYKELQNKTNPRSIALLVWKWRSDEGDRVRENPSKPSKFCLFTVLNHIVTGGEAKTSQYVDSIQQKSYFLSFLMQFSDFKSQNRLRKCVVFFCPDWLEIPCISKRQYSSRRF